MGCAAEANVTDPAAAVATARAELALWAGDVGAAAVLLCGTLPANASKVKLTGLTQNLQVGPAVCLQILMRALELPQILGQPCEFQASCAGNASGCRRPAEFCIGHDVGAVGRRSPEGAPYFAGLEGKIHRVGPKFAS